jgi:hypothetical protein
MQIGERASQPRRLQQQHVEDPADAAKRLHVGARKRPYDKDAEAIDDHERRIDSQDAFPQIRKQRRRIAKALRDRISANEKEAVYA